MSSDNNKEERFGKVRAALWPIHGYEMKKFFPMSMMMFFILFIYTLVRDQKDTLIVNAPGAGSSYISPLKLFGVLPFAMLAVVFFSKALQKFGHDKTFYVSITTFLAFYALFGFVLYPLATKIHLGEAWIKNMQKSYPIPYIDQMYPLIGNWSFSLFYIISEIWGSLVISSLFWQFANRVTRKSEVARFFGLFACVGNVGLICSGYFVKWTTHLGNNRVLAQMVSVILTGLILMWIYYYLNKNVLSDKRFYDPGDIKAKKKKAKLSLGQSFKEVFKSSYLLMIAILTIAYGVAINISEVVWKEQGKLYYGGENRFNEMMADLSINTGIVTIIITLTCSNILRKCKWGFTALITPISVLLLGGMFFALIMQQESVGINGELFGMQILWLAVQVGMYEDAVAKGIKYSLFDSTKQMAYIPLDDNLRSNGQAAVEVVGGRFGKSLGSIVIMTVTAVTGSKKLSPYVGVLAVILGIVVFSWIFAVLSLSRKYEALRSKRASEVAEAEQEKGDTAEQTNS